MRLRWCLPPLALCSLAGVLWITTHSGARTPEELLDSARNRLSSGRKEPAGRAAARRELDEALRLAQGPEQAELRAALLDERSRAYADEGALELALADCNARLGEWGASTETLARASDLCLRLGEPRLALEHAEHLAAIDPERGQSRIGRCRVALADLPLAALQRMAQTVLLPSLATAASTLAQRAAIHTGADLAGAVELEECLALFPRADERRRAGEWISEASEHLRAARDAFGASLSPGSAGEAAAGFQDLLLRGRAEREAADLGALALSLPDLTEPMPVLARTASALTALGRNGVARGLILDLKKHRPGVLDPDDLPSLAMRDELLEWCRLLEQLELWQELRDASELLCERAAKSNDPLRAARGHLFAGTAELRLGQLPAAQRELEAVGTRPPGERELTVRAWLARAELARRQGERAQERYALLLVTKSAPLDPAPPLRAAVGVTWQRLSELQADDGNPAAAEASLTHALRCSSERAAEVEPLWHELGAKAAAARGTGPYSLYAHARSAVQSGQPAVALTDASALLKDYPGLGPALEVLSRAANELRDYPLMVSTALELMERGWPAAEASARLRRVPAEFFLPQDRVRWVLLDPRGSLESVVRRLLERGDLHVAALAARGGPFEAQPPEILPLLARVALDDGDPATALAALALLPAESAGFRGCTGLALRCAWSAPVEPVATEHETAEFVGPPEAGDAEQELPEQETVAAPEGELPAAPPEPVDVLAEMIAKVVASGRAEDPELAPALDLLLASERRDAAEALLAWLAPQSPPFLGELLLRQVVGRLLAGRCDPVDEDLERAAALLDDGRPELGRLVLALEHGDAEALASEARAVLETPFARAPERRAALLLLSGKPGEVDDLLEARPRDGRGLLAELVLACLGTREADGDERGAAAGPDEPLPAALLEACPEPRLLLWALALESAPWSTWALARLQALAPEVRDEPWPRALRAQGWLALAAPAEARTALGPRPDGADPDARLAWLRVLVERRVHAPAEVVRAEELAWLERSGRSAAQDPALASLEAARALRSGAREEAAHLLETALEARPTDPDLRYALAELEDTDGRRTRALELATLVLASGPVRRDDARVLFLLDVLRRARDGGEISEERWWAEVEALETARPEDPAPVRELAARAFELRGGSTAGRALALERLTRFRARTLDRSLEVLRTGEGERWVDLLAHHAPERAVAFADEELRRDPADPYLWRASARALLASGRRELALERLVALHALAPERVTARLLALTSFELENDPARFAQRMAAMKRFDPHVNDDPVLAFHDALFAIDATDKNSEARDVEEALALWSARAENGLASSELGRTLALRLFYTGRREPALAALADARALARTELERDLLEAMAYLAEKAPAKILKLKDAPLPGPDDALADKAPRARGKKPARGESATPAAGKGKGKAQGGAAGQRPPGAGKTKGGAKNTKKAEGETSGAPAAGPGAAGKAKKGAKADGQAAPRPKAKGPKAPSPKKPDKPE